MAVGVEPAGSWRARVAVRNAVHASFNQSAPETNAQAAFLDQVHL